MKNIKNLIIKYFIFILFLIFLPFYHSHAATIGFSPSSGSYNVGDTINIKVYVGTNSQSINAISANVKFPNDILSLSSISKVGSIINLWAQEPSFSNSDGVASFEGVILNGYSGNSGNAVTLVFKVKAIGTAEIQFNTASVLANDGNGTEVLYSKGTSSLKILNAPVKQTVKEISNTKNTSIIISEIKNNISQYSPNKFLITSPQKVADNSYAVQIDSMPSIIWTDDGTHIYQSPELSNGIHVIKVMAVDVDSDQLSGTLSFYTTFLKTPTITYYPDNLYVDEFMVLKGLADPSVDIELTITNTTTGAIMINHVSTNSDGQFIFVPENKMLAGNYSITVRSDTVNGITSAYMNPIQVINKERKLNFFVSMFSNYLILLIPLIALIILIILLILYGYHRIKNFNKSLDKKLSDAKNIISKDFDTLKKDIDKEAIVSSKLKDNQKLEENEATSLVDFKDDLKNTEKDILENIKDIQV